MDTLEISSREHNSEPLVVTSESLDVLQRLRSDTPPEQAARVAGWLDQIRHSDRMFALRLETGSVLRGFAQNIPSETLASLWGKKTVVNGRAVFRPSGRVLRLEATDIQPAGGNFTFWSREPFPAIGFSNSTLHQPQTRHSGINAVIGHWPGDESDVEVARALEAMS